MRAWNFNGASSGWGAVAWIKGSKGNLIKTGQTTATEGGVQADWPAAAGELAHHQRYNQRCEMPKTGVPVGPGRMPTLMRWVGRVSQIAGRGSMAAGRWGMQCDGIK